VEAIAGWPRTTRAYTQAHVLDILSRQRALNYPPGAEYSYSNSGYNLAAMLVERVSGKPFAAFTREAIFAPLGMSSTSWRDDFHRIVKGRAIAYSENGDTVRQLMPFEDVHGNGGLLTTVGDLLKWNQNSPLPRWRARAAGAAGATGKAHRGRTIAYAAGLMVLHYKGARDEPQRHYRGVQRVVGALSGSGLWWRYSAIRARLTAPNWGTPCDVFLGDAQRRLRHQSAEGRAGMYEVCETFRLAGCRRLREFSGAACACAARWMAALGTSV
jgi:CubicO group peptidase (beta-lactamase class C family)